MCSWRAALTPLNAREDCIVVESVPHEVQTAPSPHLRATYAVPAATLAASGPVLLARDTRVRARLGLQQRASSNIRRHLVRGARRFFVLVVADLASFYVMRELVRAVRDYAVLGGSVADRVQDVVPTGILNGWQYAAALFAGLLLTGNYGRGDRRRDARRLFLGCALATALPLWMTIWTRGLEPVLVQYGLVTALVWAGLVAERMTVDRLAGWIRPPERDRLDALFIGPGPECLSAIESPAFTSGVEYRPIGFVDSHRPPMVGAMGHISDFSLLLAASGAQVVVVCGYMTDKQFQEIVDTALAAGCQLLSVPRSVKIAGVQPKTVWRRGQPLVELTAPSLKGWQFAIKRVVDVVGSVAGLMVAGPLMLGIAIAVTFDSAGPVFFCQDRMGFGGRRFRMVKFRTMRDGADREKQGLAHLNHTGDSRLFKIPNDPRVTALGARLRRWSLDELPQLWNVLTGDMSLVGPRPFFEADLRTYEDHHCRRLGAKPGITGLWQVKGRSSVVDFEEVVRLDREYIEDWSLWLDLEILALTIPAVVRRTGAY